MRSLILIVLLTLSFAGKVMADWLIDFEYWTFDDEGYLHQTHPDDASFLMGTAGITELENGYGIGFRYVLPVIDKESKIDFSLNGGVVFLIAEDKKKNENDPRPIGSHSEIYSRVWYPIVPVIGADAGYEFGKFYLGVSLDASYVSIERGWNRYAEYESAEDESSVYFMAGPEFRYIVTENIEILLNYEFSEEADVISIGWMWRF